MKKTNFIILFVFLFTLSSCSKKSEKNFFAMDTIMHLEIYGNDAEKASQAVQNEIYRLEELFSNEGELGEINKNGFGNADRELIDIIEMSKKINIETDGRFDISLKNISDLWGFYNKKYKVPTSEEINDTLKCTGMGNLTIDGNSLTLENDTKLDLGAIAKGYTGKCIINILNEMNIHSAIISLGGNIIAIGKNKNGDDWNVGIKDPNSKNDYIGSVRVSDCSVVTSGSYDRYFESDGKKYHHIIDPKTGYPSSSGVVSVTIISKDAVLADALSTALFVGGVDFAKKYHEKNKNFEYVIFTDEGEIIKSEGVEFISLQK